MSVSILKAVPPAEECPPWLLRPIRDARVHLVEKARKGAECPCCGQRVQVYRRKFNAGMAATVVAMWRELVRRERAGNPDRWIHVERLVEAGKLPKRCRDFSVARFWGVLEAKARTTRTTGTTATDVGLWSITHLGVQLCRNPRRPLIRKYVLMYANEPQAFEGPEISLAQALEGSKFDLSDLLAGGLE